MSFYVSRLKLFVKSIILVLLILTFFPFVLILRFCVSIISKCLRKDLDGMVRPWDALFCQDYDRWHTEPERTVLCSNISDSGVELEEIRSRYRQFVTKWNNRKLHQRIQIWMGYLFWQNDPDFQLEDHINWYEDKLGKDDVRDEKWLTKTKQELLLKPYLKDKTPWEILLVPNFKSEIDSTKSFCVIFFRFHHVIGDGISIRRITMEVLDELATTIEPNFPIPTKKSWITKYFEHVTFLLKAPYVFLRMLEESSDKNKSPWNNKNFKFSKISSSAKSKQIYLPFLKEIKNKRNVSLNSVILLGVSSILRRAFIKAKIELPDTVHCIFSLPLPNHPEELCHHATAALFEFPIGIADPRKRLTILNNNLENLKNSIAPQVPCLYASIYGRLPYTVLKKSPRSFITGSLSIFPGGTGRQQMLGRNYYSESFCLRAHNPESFTGLFIACFTNTDVLTIDAHFDRSIFNLDSDVEELFDSLYEDYNKVSTNDLDPLAISEAPCIRHLV